MKEIFQLLFFLFSIGVSACTCDDPSITEKYVHSDIVAKAKIIKNYDNEGSRDIYKAEILISEIFKGKKVKSIYVAGRSDGLLGNSCSIFIPENTELIIYASKNSDGNYSVGMCSGLLYMNARNLKRQKKELNILRKLKSKKIDLTNKIYFQEKASLSKKLKKFKGIKLDKRYSIYEITFDSNLNIKNVKEISGFGNPIDEKLLKILYTTEWKSFDKGIKNKVPDNTKILFGFYYYEAERDSQSFISQYYL